MTTHRSRLTRRPRRWARGPGREWFQSSGGLSVPESIDTGCTERGTLELVVEVQGRLGATQEQVAVRAEHPADLGENPTLHGGIEIDEHVAQEDDVDRLHGGQRDGQVEFTKAHHLADGLAQGPLRPRTLEVAHHQGRGQPAVDLELAVTRTA